MGGIVLLYFSAPMAYNGLTSVMRTSFGDVMAQPVTMQSAAELMGMAILRSMGSLVPLGCGLMVVAMLASYGQVGLLVTTEAVKPKLTNLDPVNGLKRLFSLRALMTAALALVKLGIIVAVFYVAVRNRLPEFFLLSETSASGVLSYLCPMVAMVALQVCAVLAVVALADLAYQRWEHERKMRMTHQELREETKRMDGDPLVKSRIRQVQREVARRRMMQDLPNADAVVTNPTHYAVALRYDAATMEAPSVVAKGRDLLAARIKDVARQHGIPLVEDRFLARALYRSVEVGSEVPYALYQVVARVLTYVYQLRRRQSARYVPLAEPMDKRDSVGV